MDWSNRVTAFLSDERLLTNLIAVHVVVGALLILSVLVRQMLQSGGDRLFSWAGMPSLRDATQEAAEQMRNLVYWITLGLMLATAGGGILYHLAGRDVRQDLADLWHAHITSAQLIALALAAAELAGLALATWLAGRLLRLLRRKLEAAALAQLPRALDGADSAAENPLPADDTPKTITRWFNVLERFGLALLVLGGLAIAARIASAPILAGVVDFTLPLLATVLIARLLTLGAHTLARALAAFGNRSLGRPPFRRYWDRVLRLFPFGEKCFEAVVYVWAAGTLLGHLRLSFHGIEERSSQLTECIGIFFLTRVLIELLHVLLNEAFGMYDEARPPDQKGQTLVPLLESAVSYTLYFGSAIVMLEVVKGPTQTILAGAGLFGLAVGLGAQSLVGDVVSGFFILFENQYLVGDVVRVGDADGRVEAVSIRHTQIRDEEGKLHIIPNGQIKSVVNYSKSYVNAVVDIKVPTGISLEQVTRDLVEAGRRLRATRREVLGETVVKGLVDLTPGEMTVRAVTKVMPGAHRAMQCEFRRLLREVFEQGQASRAAA